MAQQNTRKCPQCGTVARQKQIYCGGCGQRLTICSICNTIKPRGLASEESSVSLPSVGVESRQVMQPGKPGPAISVRMLETTESSDMDGRVLKYLEDHHGGISIRRTSNDLNVTTEQLIDSLTRLQKRGLIQKEETTFVERMHNCHTCNKTIGADEPYCRYCGAKQALIEELEPQAILDPRTMKVAL